MSVARDSCKVNQIQFETVFIKLKMFGVSTGTCFIYSITVSRREREKKKHCYGTTEQNLSTDSK